MHLDCGVILGNLFINADKQWWVGYNVFKGSFAWNHRMTRLWWKRGAINAMWVHKVGQNVCFVCFDFVSIGGDIIFLVGLRQVCEILNGAVWSALESLQLLISDWLWRIESQLRRLDSGRTIYGWRGILFRISRPNHYLPIYLNGTMSSRDPRIHPITAATTTERCYSLGNFHSSHLQ